MALVLACVCSAGALRAPPIRSDNLLSRRHVLQSAPAVGALVGYAPSAYAASSSRKLDDIKVLASKSRSLRSYVRQTSANRRLFPMDPAGGNYVNVANTVKRGQKEVLLPLREAMIEYVAATSLPDEELQKQLALQPQLMLGHLSELDFYLKKEKFDQYTSKTTGDDYPGGKVERELEEVCDTAADFILLAQGKPAPVRVD
jgi:hypothetical protein